MGKHDKKEATFSWHPMPDEYYKARITTLEKENLALREKVNELEKSLGQLELVIDHDEVMTDGIIAEYKEEIENLQKALIASALREVQK